MTPFRARRTFLTLLGTSLGGAALYGSSSGLRTAMAASSVSGYKALVCLYLNGGNDGFNWLVPTTAAAYATYASSRSVLALPNDSTLHALNGVASDSNSYALHPSCTNLAALFNAGKAAFVCNVGTLVQPTTVVQAQQGSVPLPSQLFSHADQTAEWMTSIPQSPTRYGWAGRIADLLVAQGNTPHLSFNYDIGGANYWQEGASTTPYVVSTNGPSTTAQFGNSYYRGGARKNLMQTLLTQAAGDSNLMVAQHAAIWQSAETKYGTLNAALSSAGDLATVFPAPATDGGQDWGLSQQLHEVARIIKAQSLLGDARQIFFVQLGGFDTHDGELATQARLLAYVDAYLQVFWTALAEIGQQSNVTLFTMSDFGRTLAPNNDGADHGWGNHHLVMGGAVNGGHFYGSMPSLVIGGPNDFGFGRLVPTTATDQYAATLASWFGVSNADLATVFPNLTNFSTAPGGINLGFV